MKNSSKKPTVAFRLEPSQFKELRAEAAKRAAKIGARFTASEFARNATLKELKYQ